MWWKGMESEMFVARMTENTQKTFCSMCESQVDITDMDTGKVCSYGHYQYGHWQS
jgi:hypothetical protein